MYSLSAGLVSVVASAFLVQFAYPKVSLVAVSVVAAVLHNLTQNVVFCLVSNTPQMFIYMPYLALLGVLAGLIVGFGVWFILRSVPTRTFAALLDIDLPVAEQPEQSSQPDPTPESNDKTEE